MELHESLEQVKDAASFLAFVGLLIEDRLREAGGTVDPFGRGPAGWENHTIESFLEAAVRWAEDSDFGARQDLADAPPWKRCAAFLYAGKVYE